LNFFQEEDFILDHTQSGSIGRKLNVRWQHLDDKCYVS